MKIGRTGRIANYEAQQSLEEKKKGFSKKQNPTYLFLEIMGHSYLHVMCIQTYM